MGLLTYGKPTVVGLPPLLKQAWPKGGRGRGRAEDKLGKNLLNRS